MPLTSATRARPVQSGRKAPTRRKRTRRKDTQAVLAASGDAAQGRNPAATKPSPGTMAKKPAKKPAPRVVGFADSPAPPLPARTGASGAGHGPASETAGKGAGRAGKGHEPKQGPKRKKTMRERLAELKHNVKSKVKEMKGPDPPPFLALADTDAVPLPPGIVHHGILEKKGRKRHNFALRWFALSEAGQLVYYELVNKPVEKSTVVPPRLLEDKVERGRLDLTAQFYVQVLESKNDWEYRFSINTDERCLVVRTPLLRMCESWVIALADCPGYSLAPRASVAGLPLPLNATDPTDPTEPTAPLVVPPKIKSAKSRPLPQLILEPAVEPVIEPVVEPAVEPAPEAASDPPPRQPRPQPAKPKRKPVAKPRPPQRKQRPQPAKPQPAKPQPAKPQPAKPQPAKPQPAKPQPAKPQPAEPQPAKPPAKPQPAKPQPAKPPAEPQPAKPPAKPQPAKPQPAKPKRKPRPQPAKPQPAKPQPAEPQPAKPRPTKPRPSKPKPSKPQRKPQQPPSDPDPTTPDPDRASYNPFV